MKARIWLVVSPHGVERMTKRAPTLYRHEGAVQLTISVPDAAFKSFTMSAEVEVAEAQVMQPTLEITVAEPEPEPG